MECQNDLDYFRSVASKYIISYRRHQYSPQSLGLLMGGNTLFDSYESAESLVAIEIAD